MYLDPKTKEPLREEEGFLIAVESQARYPIEDGVPNFLKSEDLTGLNARYERLYNRFGRFYDSFSYFLCPLFTGKTIGSLRREFVRELEVSEGFVVLETSIGTGQNIEYLPKRATYFGLDLSRGMLNVCKKKLRRLGFNANLCLGNAELLPYPSNTFDFVFHNGGINFFNDRKSAIEEMIRVAKPGAKIVIADETIKTHRISTKIPGVKVFYEGNPEILYQAPVDLIPRNMQEIRVKELYRSDLYCLSFRKPI